MEKKLGVIYALPALMSQLHDQIAARFPDVILIELCDTGLLYDETHNGELPRVTDRIIENAVYFEKMGCQAMLVTFSAFYQSVLAARRAVTMPVFAIQEPMVQQAVQAGKRLAIVRSHGVQNDPTLELLSQVAQQQNVEQQVDLFMAQGGIEAQMAGRQEEFERLILTTAREAAVGHDALVLLQASLQPFVALLGDIGIPVLNSVVSGIEQLRSVYETSPGL